MRVLTVGSFDILHKGHLWLLHHCRRLAGPTKYGYNEVIVGVNSDDLIEEFKGHRPVVPLDHRAAVLCNLSVADSVVTNTDNNVLAMIKEYKAELLVVGSDWGHPKDYLNQVNLTFGDLEKQRCLLVFVPVRGTVHSSDFREKM